MAPNSSRTPIEIAQWLRELGLGQYAEAFRENAIDAKILPTLTPTSDIDPSASELASVVMSVIGVGLHAL